jgi:hypothetical protein
MTFDAERREAWLRWENQQLRWRLDLAEARARYLAGVLGWAESAPIPDPSPPPPLPQILLRPEDRDGLPKNDRLAESRASVFRYSIK